MYWNFLLYIQVFYSYAIDVSTLRILLISRTKMCRYMKREREKGKEGSLLFIALPPFVPKGHFLYIYLLTFLLFSQIKAFLLWLTCCFGLTEYKPNTTNSVYVLYVDTLLSNTCTDIYSTVGIDMNATLHKLLQSVTTKFRKGANLLFNI